MGVTSLSPRKTNDVTLIQRLRHGHDTVCCVLRSEIPAGSALRSRPDRPPPPAKAAPGGRKVRSSGYGAPNPRRLMFQPRTNAARAKVSDKCA